MLYRSIAVAGIAAAAVVAGAPAHAKRVLEDDDHDGHDHG